MALDGLVVRAIVHDLQQIVGGRVSKIHQPTPHDIILQLRAASGNARLLLSANLTYPRVHLTDKQLPNPTEPPMFCMLLRKHCEGGVIEAVEQTGAERVIRIRIRQRDELGDISSKVILIEIMGRHSNIILLDPRTDTIMDGIHHVTPALSSYRVVMPGFAYTPPPEQDKRNPWETDRDSFLHEINEEMKSNALNDSAPVALEKALVARFSGVSPLAAREIVYRAKAAGAGVTGTDAPWVKAVGAAAAGTDTGVGSAEMETSDSSSVEPLTPERLWTSFSEIMEAMRSNRYQPNIVRAERTGKLAFSVIALTHIEGEAEPFLTVSACLDRFYSEKAERDTVKQRTSDLQRLLQNEKHKNEKKLEKLEETLEEAKEADSLRVIGELLTSSLHLIRKGDKSVEVVNYYDEEQRPLIIALDPQLTPSENSQRYFKKYAKAKNSLVVVEEQMKLAREEIVYLGSLLAQLSVASLSDVEEIRDELVEQGYLRDRRKAVKKKKKDRPALTCYTSSEGIPIYVGKNNLQNEYLTNRLAKPSDTWLHTKDIPGSHVVIRSDAYGEDTLLEAAQLAAYYSQARGSSSVPVDYTLIRYVRKPNGSKPGFVIYDRQKTLFATPDETLVGSLKSALA
ncbi:Rqc2 family fibronectin-binding protein [Gorillibacterium timonense]|uniref:Rqc2 family fibronectin-binding protein n=1 Tax=Gorillibacterium timonense TaxID=1689269 RepID=UPI00071C53A9|nr:NFACT RNA binding domain-containing protein [Gorillibacterium timonense]